MELKHENIFHFLVICFLIAVVGLLMAVVKSEKIQPAASTAPVARSASIENAATLRVPTSKPE